MKKAKYILPFTSLLFLVAAGCSPSNPREEKTKQESSVVLASRGCQPSWAIFIKPDAFPSVRYAAEELRDHLKKLTGIELEVFCKESVPGTSKKAISIGLKDDSAIGDDGFEISISKDSVSILGGRRGVLYGVYELLERYGGIMWLSSDHTHVPDADEFSVPCGLVLRDKPAFRTRHIDTYGCYEGVQDFGARLRLNEFTPDEKFGGCDPSFDPILCKCHTFHRIISVEKYYDSHPEYFSLVKGKRLREHTQLCLTNPDVFGIVLSNVLHRIEANKRSSSSVRRSIRYYGVSADDWNNFCECESCAAIDAREESNAGCVIWFVNKIAEEVEKKYPDVIIETLAYLYSRKPPKYLRPRDNVMVCLCTIECDFSKPMTVNRYKENVDFRTNILKWREIAKHLYLWDYAANWRATPVPYPNIKAYVENIRFYHEAGVRYLFEHGISSPAATLKDLKGWLGSKLMWNPYQPADPLIRRFCEAYYGKAAPFVMEFIELMGRQEIDETKTPVTYAMELPRMPFKKEFYEQGRELWIRAEEAVQGESEIIRRNVRWGRFGLEYALAATYARLGVWRAVILSERIVKRLDKDEFLRMRECARYCQRLLDSDSRGMVSSRLNDARLKGYLKALANAEFPEAQPSQALIQDWAVNYNDFPKSTTVFRVGDNDATDRSAVSVKGEKKERGLSCSLKPLLALDKGKKYRLRVRIKADPPKGSQVRNTALSVELFDRVAKKVRCSFDLDGKEATGRYSWYELGEWTDEGNDCVLYVHPRGSTFSLDCFEVSIVK